MGRSQLQNGGGYTGNKGNQTHTEGGNRTPKAVDAASALGLGVLPPQHAMLPGFTGPGVAQPNSLGSMFGSAGTNPLAGVTGLHTGLHSANGAIDLLQLAAILGGQEQSVTFQPAQLLQAQQPPVQQQAAQVATHQAEMQKRIETEATK